MSNIESDDPSSLIPHHHCEGCGLALPPVRRNRRYHDNKCKQEAYRKRKVIELETLLVESCYLLNSYAEIMTWDEELDAHREELYTRIEACLRRSVHPVP